MNKRNKNAIWQSIKPERRIPKKIRNQVWKRDGGKCVYCRKKPRKKSLFKSARILQYGHYIAFSRGGDNCLANIQLECVSCNLKKGVGVKKAGIFNNRGVRGCTKRHARSKNTRKKK